MRSSRPIWKGSISFGLVMIPVTLFPSENQNNLHFHLLDKRNNTRIRYERINEDTGKPVPWHEVVKGYEFEKGNYILIDEQELERTAYKNYDTIEIENFIEKSAIESLFFEKAYYLSPSKQGIKGYALLQKILKQTKKAGIAKVVIRSRQHLAAVMSYENILLLNLLRFPEEVRGYQEFQIPEDEIKNCKLSSKEIEMAERLVKSMSAKWDPNEFHDNNREILKNWIDKKIKTGKSVAEPVKEKAHIKTGKVIDFMSLLQKSIQEKENKANKAKGKSKKVSNKSVKMNGKLEKNVSNIKNIKSIKNTRNAKNVKKIKRIGLATRSKKIERDLNPEQPKNSKRRTKK